MLTTEEAALWSKVIGVHSPVNCFFQSACPVHKPSNHHMRSWTLLWRYNRGIVERVCKHGVGHPDPDQFPYWNETNQTWQATHGCDGCCVNRGGE